MSKFDLAAKIAARLAEGASSVPKEQKMLQGMYRGYAGGYDTAKAAIDSGLIYATPQRAAAEAYAANRAKQAAKRGVDDTPHVEMLMVDPFAGRRYGHSTLGSGATPPLRTLAGEYTPEQIESVTNLYAQGGTVNKPQGMEHTTSSSQDASTQPLTGSALKALVRGWIAGTAGLPGDLEGLARKGVNWSFGPGGVNVDEAPALPTSDFYKDWLPGKQQGDEMINDIGSVFGGVGATKPVSLAKGALSRVAAAAPGPMAGSRAAMRGVIKAPGGNWLSGSVEDALKGLKRPEMGNYNPPGTWVPDAPNEALNQFVDKQLTKYIKNDMATERDPIRALAERGVLHTAMPEGWVPERIDEMRRVGGFPVEGAGKSQLAKNWENTSDSMLSMESAENLLGYGHGAKNQWLNKVPPASLVNEIDDSRIASNLGFDHLVDELRNAVNINSGLPAHLRLDPESLARVSVPQAVERVAKINDWRAAQKVAADQARANNAATLLHKDYPDKGFKWVELRVGDDAKLPGGFSLEPEKFARSGELAGYRVIGPDKKSVAFGKTEAEAIREANIPALKDALKYEGDTMGHCVGGYCDEVASGKSRIYSLRDAKGQPHTTIEVQPGIAPPRDAVRWSDLPEELQESMASRGLAPSEHELINTYFDPVKGTRYLQYDPRIVQIKGKANKAPNPEYLPYVQDFVKSGKWSDVGDLNNTGLRKTSDIFGPTELEQFKANNVQIPHYLGDEERKALQDQWYRLETGKDPATGYATGGTVAAPAPAPAPTWLDTYNSWVNQHKGQFGGQDMNRAWDADPDAVKQKTALDDTYLAALAAYNKANGTNLAPDSAVLGASAQPNTFTPTDHSRDGFFGHASGAIGDTLKDPSKGLTNLSHDIAKSPIAAAALTAVGAYFGVPPSLTAALLGANRTGMDGDIAAGLKTGIASYGAGNLMPDLGWGQAAQTAAGNTFSGLLGGNNIGDSLKNAGIGYIGGQAGSQVADLTGSDFAGKAANSLTQTALKGKDISSTLDQLATQYASGQLTDLSGMDPKMAAIVVNLARNKKSAATGIATGALTQAAQRAVGSTKLSDLAVGS